MGTSRAVNMVPIADLSMMTMQFWKDIEKLGKHGTMLPEGLSEMLVFKDHVSIII